MRFTHCATALALALTACAAAPAVQKTSTILGEVDLTGLECRRETPIGANIPRTVCASPEAWAAYEARAADHARRQIDEADRYTNVFQFGRGP